jgi:hypothetical protein
MPSGSTETTEPRWVDWLALAAFNGWLIMPPPRAVRLSARAMVMLFMAGAPVGFGMPNKPGFAAHVFSMPKKAAQLRKWCEVFSFG